MIFLTGDTHGSIDITKLTSDNFPEGKSLTKDDYVIILGDFGFLWDGSKEQWYWLDWFKNKPWTTLFIDGNHENFDMLNEYPVELWNGGKVHRINDSVIHLMRGQVFTLENLKFFTFGGGLSIDKEYRREHISWWSQEIPNYYEIEEGLKNIYEHEQQVDYVLTHTCPTTYVGSLNSYKIDDPVCKILDEFEGLLKFKHWYFAHFHTSQQVNSKFTVLYNEVLRLT